MVTPWHAGLLEQARAIHREILIETVRIERVTGHTIGALKTRTPIWSTVYEDAGLVQKLAVQSVKTDSAGKPLLISTHVLKVPLEVDVLEGDRVTVIESPDPRNLRTFLVAEVDTQGLATVRRCLLEAI